MLPGAANVAPQQAGHRVPDEASRPSRPAEGTAHAGCGNTLNTKTGGETVSDASNLMGEGGPRLSIDWFLCRRGTPLERWMRLKRDPATQVDEQLATQRADRVVARKLGHARLSHGWAGGPSAGSAQIGVMVLGTVAPPRVGVSFDDAGRGGPIRAVGAAVRGRLGVTCSSRRRRRAPRRRCGRGHAPGAERVQHEADAACQHARPERDV